MRALLSVRSSRPSPHDRLHLLTAHEPLVIKHCGRKTSDKSVQQVHHPTAEFTTLEIQVNFSVNLNSLCKSQHRPRKWESSPDLSACELGELTRLCIQDGMISHREVYAIEDSTGPSASGQNKAIWQTPVQLYVPST